MQEPSPDCDAATSTVPTDAQIIASARKCFEAVGIRRTTVEDIAAAAGVSRQTVYKYFSNKQDIADRIGLSEMMEVQASLRRMMTRHSRFADKITEAVWVSAKVAKENPFVRRMIEDLELLPGLRSPTDPIYLWHRAQWDSVLTAARKSGELSPALTLDQIALWLSMSQLMMVIVMDKLPHFLIGEEEIREFIRRFVVDPLLAERGAPAAKPSETADALRTELDSLRALVAEQALELRALKRGGAH